MSPGTPPGPSQKQALADIVESGAVAYGYLSGVWTAPMITRVIEDEFGVTFHPGHVRKLLHQLGFSVQRPKRKLARADRQAQGRWHRHTYPNPRRAPQRKGRR